MKRRLLKGLALALLSLLALIGLGLALVPGKARTLLRDASQSALGVPASLGGVDMSLEGFNIQLLLVDFDIHNPPGFEGAPLLHMGRASCDLRATSLLAGTIAVDHLVVQDLRLRIIQDGSRSNLAPLLKQLAQRLRAVGMAQDGQQQPTPSQPSGPRLDLKNLTLRAVGVDFELRGLGRLNVSKSATLPDWTLPLEDLRAPDGGSPTLDDLVAYLFQECHERALLEADKHVPAELLPLLRGASVEDLIRDGLNRELLELLPAEVLDDLGEITRKAQDKLKDQLRGLFNDH